jgi:ribosome-associated protein
VGVSPHQAAPRFGDRDSPFERSKAITSRSKPAQLTAEDLVDLVVDSLDGDKAEDITIVDLRGKSSMADHMVIATGRSSRQVGSMADHVMRTLKDAGLGVGAEGMALGDWVLIDGGDIIVHLFKPEVRAFYNLEKMWGGGTVVQSTALPVGAGDQHAQAAGSMA